MRYRMIKKIITNSQSISHTINSSMHNLSSAETGLNLIQYFCWYTNYSCYYHHHHHYYCYCYCYCYCYYYYYYYYYYYTDRIFCW